MEFFFGVFGDAEDQQLQKDAHISFGSTFTEYMREVRCEKDQMKIEQPFQIDYVSSYKGKERPYFQYVNIPAQHRFDIKNIDDYIKMFESLYPGVNNVEGIHNMGDLFKNKTGLRVIAYEKIPPLNEKVLKFIELYNSSDINSINKSDIEEAKKTFADYSSNLDVIAKTKDNDLQIQCPNAVAIQKQIGENYSDDKWITEKEKFNKIFANETLPLATRIGYTLILSEKFSCINKYLIDGDSLPGTSVMSKSHRIFIQQKSKYFYNCIVVCHNNDVDSFQSLLTSKGIKLQLQNWFKRCPCQTRSL